VSSPPPTSNPNTHTHPNPPPATSTHPPVHKHINPGPTPCAKTLRTDIQILKDTIAAKTNENSHNPLLANLKLQLNQKRKTLKQVYRKKTSAHLLAHAHKLKVTPFTATFNTAWKLLRDYKGDDSSASPQLPSQMRTNISADKRMWTEGDTQREPHIGIKSLLLPFFLLSLSLLFLSLSPWDESEADRFTQTLNSPHPSDSHFPDPEFHKTPTREEVKEMHLPSDKAAGPDGITNRILQASGEQAINMIYVYMLIIWEVETYPEAWASALMQPIYKGGGKYRHSPVSYRSIYLLNTLTKLLKGLMEARLSKFTELNDSLAPFQQGSRITHQTHDAIYALIATIQERSQYGFSSYCCFIDFATAYPSVHRERLMPYDRTVYLPKWVNVSRVEYSMIVHICFCSRTLESVFVSSFFRDCVRFGSKLSVGIVGGRGAT